MLNFVVSIGATDVAAQKISEAVVNIFVATLSGNIKLFPWEPMIPVPSPTQIFQVVLSGKNHQLLFVCVYVFHQCCF